jgi:serine/threonine protein kinase
LHVLCGHNEGARGAAPEEKGGIWRFRNKKVLKKKSGKKGVEMDNDNPWGFIHPCSEVLDITDAWIEADNDCFKKIRAIYKAVEKAVPLGSGSSATVFRLITKDSNRSVAVKVIPYATGKTEKDTDEDTRYIAVRELGIACEVNELAEMSPCFVRSYGYLVCSDIPASWRKKLPQNGYIERFDVYILLFMEQPEYAFDGKMGGDGQYQLDFDHYGLSLFYLLLHAIYVGRKYIGLDHRDIAAKNILFASQFYEGDGDEKVLQLNFTTKEEDEGKEHKKISRVRFHSNIVPKIIDFGHSSTRRYPGQVGLYSKTDVEMVLKALGTRSDISNQRWYTFLTTNFTYENDDYAEQLEIRDEFEKLTSDGPEEFEALETFLRRGKLWKFFEDDLIQIGKIRNRKKPKTVESCMFCHLEAKVAFEGLKNYRFCNSYCAQRVGELAHFIKKKIN